MTSKTYFLLFFISWQQFKATPHSCSSALLLCMMKNRWGTQIYKLLKPISISSVVARAGLGLEWRLFNVQTWSRGGGGGGHSWHCRVISTDTATDIRRAKTSQSKDHHYDCQTKISRLLPTASHLAAHGWPLTLTALVMRLAFSTLGENIDIHPSY